MLLLLERPLREPSVNDFERRIHVRRAVLVGEQVAVVSAHLLAAG